LRSSTPAPAPGGGRPAPPAREDFRRITIVGLGLMGGSLALAFRRAGFRGKLVGVSRPESLAEARRLGAIDEGFGYEELAAGAAQADLVILATPIHQILAQLEVLGRAPLAPGALVTDVGSTKREVLAAAERALGARVHFIGGHPMAGSEKRGMAAADPFLFENAYYVLTPQEGTPPGEVDRLAELVGRTGARVVVLTAEEHDRIAAAISHLPQLLAVALVNSLEELGPLRDHALRLAAGGFRDMTRIASSPFPVWRDILATNRTWVSKDLSAFRAALAEAAARLEGGAAREPEVEREFERAARTRAAIPRDTKGFLSTMWEVLVVVEDRPGMIAAISTALAARGINIKDIEVLKVREGEGGSLRLAFATRQVAEEALSTLAAHGFSGRLRE
jgi:prephenate dehydrogenase